MYNRYLADLARCDSHGSGFRKIVRFLGERHHVDFHRTREIQRRLALGLAGFSGTATGRQNSGPRLLSEGPPACVWFVVLEPVDSAKYRLMPH